MDRDEIEAALRVLGDELKRRGVVGAKLWVCGGTVMVLEIGSRDATNDVDCALHPRREILESAAAVAGSLGLRENWLNDKASAYYPDGADDSWRQPPRHFGALDVYLADDRMMLALKMMLAFKLRAGRGRLDRPDVVALLKRLRISSEEAALEIFEHFYPHDVISKAGLETLRSSLQLSSSVGSGTEQ